MDKLRSVGRIREWVLIRSDGGKRSRFGRVLGMEVFDEF